MIRAQAAIRTLPCDGCGQLASSEHIARRLHRLELTTRYRPIHLQAVFLGAESPELEAEFLYGAEATFQGEAADLLRALNIESAGRATDAVLLEFQKKGYLLTHVLECAGEHGGVVTESLKRKLPSVLKRLRTSLRPKRVVVFSAAMVPLVPDLRSAQVGAEVLLDDGAPFDLGDRASATRLRSRL
jgi:hypothetical protein